MNRGEMLALEGRELDVKVAEALGCYDIKRYAVRGLVVRDPRFTGRHVNLPFYSTEWQAMGWLVQAMRERGYSLALYSPTQEEPGPWLAFWVGETSAEGPGETAPLAVARAALLALSEEE